VVLGTDGLGGGLCAKAVATPRTNKTPISRRNGDIRAENRGAKGEGMAMTTCRCIRTAA